MAIVYSKLGKKDNNDNDIILIVDESNPSAVKTITRPELVKRKEKYLVRISDIDKAIEEIDKL